MDILKKELILGTANFNRSYRLSQKTNFEATKLLIKAYENGINTLDISNSYNGAYGFVADTGLDWKLNAKIVLPEQKKSLEYEIRLKVLEIFELMPKVKISNLMIHNISDVSSFGINAVSIALRKIAKEFEIKKIGISLYPEQILNISSENFDLIQIPINVVDQRVLTRNILENFLQPYNQVQARSIYLRGLLASSSEIFEQKDQLELNTITLFKDWCRGKGLNPSFVCMNFVYHLSFVTQIIFGANDINELNENIDYFNKSKFTKINIPYKDFESNNLKLIDPRYWNS